MMKDGDRVNNTFTCTSLLQNNHTSPILPVSSIPDCGTVRPESYSIKQTTNTPNHRRHSLHVVLLYLSHSLPSLLLIESVSYPSNYDIHVHVMSSSTSKHVAIIGAGLSVSLLRNPVVVSQLDRPRDSAWQSRCTRCPFRVPFTNRGQHHTIWVVQSCFRPMHCVFSIL